MPLITNDSSAGLPAAPDPRTPESSELSLWLTLRGSAADPFGDAISRLAEALEGPVFKPHVTLWGRFRASLAEAQLRVEELTRELPPVPLRGHGIGMQGERFRALFVPVAVTPELWRGHLAARDALAAGAAIEYMPHLSLYYGERPPRQKLAALGALDPLPALDHVADAVSLVSVDGPPERWVTRAILPLRGRSAC